MANTGNIPRITPFDPFPFGLLTMVVSLEAIFLSIFILVSQNRSSYISTIRDEVHMGVSLISEEEITKILSVLAEIRTEMGIKKQDKELDKTLERIDTSYLERTITEQLRRANKPLVEKLLNDLSTITHADSNSTDSGNNSNSGEQNETSTSKS